MELRQEYLICYDVADTKIRSKVFNELEKIGMKAVQKSVFWGCLTHAELSAIFRFIKDSIEHGDKALITRTNFNGQGHSFLIGHEKEEFSDWKENYVI